MHVILCRGRGRPRGSTKRPRDESARSGHKAMEYVERDAQKVAQPDISTPFLSLDDVIERLLPYHVCSWNIQCLDVLLMNFLI